MRKKSGLIFILSLAVAAGCSSSPKTDWAWPSSSAQTTPSNAPASGPSTSEPPAQTTPADLCGAPFLSSLSQRQKLAQLLTVGVTGTADAVQVVRDEQVGGIFIGSWTDKSILSGGGIGQVNGAAKVPPMVTVDEEGGRVDRLAGLIGPTPSAREQAQMSVDQVYELAKTRGQKMHDLGVTVDFAPVVDVSSQGDDTVIGDRSFSADPNVVATYAGAWVRGLRDAGVGAVIKHFPGHGSGSGDSHTGAVTTPPLDQLKTVDLQPYRMLIPQGVGVMVGHLDVPGLTTPNVPASISPQAMTLLRDGIGYIAPPFAGPIFTDDLSGMAAITNRLGIAQAVEAALVAGADVALWITTDAVGGVLDNLEQAVASGRLSQQRVDDSVMRVAKFKGAVRC